MSSNVGLSTPRGSGTSGYVQRNLSTLKPRNNTYSPYPTPGSKTNPRDLDASAYRPRQPNREILEHDRLRDIEVKVVEYRDKLEDEGIEDEEELDRRVEELRAELVKDYEDAKARGSSGGGGGRDGRSGGARADRPAGSTKQIKRYQVHELAEAKIAESERLRQALGIRRDFDEGGGAWGGERADRLRGSLKEDEEIKKAVVDGGDDGYGRREKRRERSRERSPERRERR